MSDQSATPEQGSQESAPEQAPAQEQSGPPEWLGPIEERMNELRDQNVALAEHIASLTGGQEEEEDEFDLYDDDGDLTPEAAQAIIDQRVTEAVNSRWSEQQATEALNLRDVAFDELRDRVPALQDDKVATHLVTEVAAELRDAGYEAIVETPLFVDLIEQRHKATQFDERAASEQPPQRGVVLESGAGAAPQQRQEEEDWGERILKAAERISPKI